MKKNTKITIGKKIELARRLVNMSQEILATTIDVSRNTINRWEKGHTSPTHSDIEMIAKATNRPLSYFLAEDAESYASAQLYKSNITPEIFEALQDPVAVKALLITHKNSKDIKNAIKEILECLPNLTSEKRQAILALCK